MPAIFVERFQLFIPLIVMGFVPPILSLSLPSNFRLGKLS
ncbi:unnamed protein product [Arabidopsis halleri]